MARRWTPWAWVLGATVWLLWTFWLPEVTDGGWVLAMTAVILGLGLAALIRLARRADRTHDGHRQDVSDQARP